MPNASEPLDLPHQPLTGYYGSEEERCDWIRELFDHTAVDYERIERLVGLGAGSWYRNQALRRAGLRAGMSVLDIGVGTGLFMREAARVTGDPSRIVGLDPSIGMLRAAHAPRGVKLVVGRAENLPVEAGQFDFVSMGYVLRYLGSISQAFDEIYRVLKPGGRICLIEMGRPTSRPFRSGWAAYINGFLPILTRLIARDPQTPRLVRYLWDTVDGSIASEKVVRAIERAGFDSVRCEVAFGIFFSYYAQKPVT